MKKYAVCGNPIGHSLSPQIYSQLFQLNNCDACYSRILAKNVEDAVYLFNEFELSGMNVTAPFKSSVLPYLSDITEDAKEINAVNIIVKFKDKKIGFNTDWEGVLMLVRYYLNKKNNTNILIIGAGNTAAAVIYALKKFYPSVNITVYNRTERKLSSLFQINTCIFSDKFDNSIIKQNDIIISTIPNPNIFTSKIEIMQGKHYIFADYMQQKYFSSIKSKNPNTDIISGEKLLLEQAFFAFEYFYKNDAFCNNVELNNDTIQQHFNKLKYSHIWLIGFSGTGKTTIAKCFAEKLNLNYIDTDIIIEEQFGMPIYQYFAKYGEESFRKKETELIKKIIAKEKNKTIISLGGGAIINPVNYDMIKKSNGNIIYIYADLKFAMSRININEKPILQVCNIEDLFRTRRDIYFQVSDLIINNIDSVETAKLLANITATYSTNL